MSNLGDLFRDRSPLKVVKSGNVLQKKSFEDILDFFDHCSGIEPTPQQRFIFKCIYGLPLDKKTKSIEIWDQFKENRVNKLTEYDFFLYLKDENRINQESPEAMVGRKFTSIVLPIGRRGSKSFLTGGIEAYEASRLLDLYDPHGHYGLIPSEPINFRSVAPKGSQAGLIFNFARAVVASNKYFDKYLVRDIKDSIAFNTPFEIAQKEMGRSSYFNKKGSIIFSFEACMSRHLRGPGHYFCAMDELAHYVLETNSITSDQQVFDALEPSMATFIDKKTNTRDSKMFLISNPLNQSGVLYNKYLESYNSPESTIMIQLPTWEANPTRITSDTLRNKFKENEEVFWVEYGARFSSTIDTYAQRDWLESNFEKGAHRIEKGISGVRYYLGLDLGQKKDKTVFTLTHLDADSNVIFDFQETWDPVDFGGSIEIDRVVNFIQDLSRRFSIQEGIFDQFNGWALQDLLRTKGLKGYHYVSITEQLKNQMFKATKDYLRHGKIKGYWDEDLFNEILMLREIRKSENITSIVKLQGHSDDRADSFVRSIWLAIEAIEKQAGGREFRTDQQKMQRIKTIRRRGVQTRQGATNMNIVPGQKAAMMQRGRNRWTR